MILATVKELSGFLRVPAGTLYRWAIEDRWTKYGNGHRRLYSVDQVTRSHSLRRGA